MTVYGPHCSHAECGWIACDHTGEVEYSCRDQATCPYCGPESPDWPRIAKAELAWTIEYAGTADPDELRALDVPPNVVERAELIAAHYRPDAPAADPEAGGR
ncbi:hypothetical protein [Micromonospora cathayae]|uniref:Uncharacterized protein n=1 Tax=Micromonospora cathayae TaxID=3028804 RepID=A0ABY7ZQA6_9ACTN|nr:hypothetical protein [Micromonospora sp. HUAS 3]WDZ84054.1 hypothetical protein PVK37_26875 [Micromonospora sp. HUAS 3]